MVSENGVKNYYGWRAAYAGKCDGTVYVRMYAAGL